MNDLLLVKENIVYNNNNVTLLAVLQDEIILLPYFIQFYKKMGVENFIFIDNNSEDGSYEYLYKKNDINITLYHTKKSYKDANFGLDWVNYLLDKYCKDKWCIVVDIDELLTIKNSLSDLINKMERFKCNITFNLLLDMYPKSNTPNYKSGNSFLEHSNYYDKFTVKYNRYHSLLNDIFQIFGGVRKRLFGVDNCISKISLFKYTFYNNINLGIGYHTLNCHNNENFKSNVLKNINIYPDMNILLHFKFIKPNLKDFFLKRVNNNQDWDNSSEYKKYLGNYKDSFYKKDYSIKYINEYKLYKDMNNYFIFLKKYIKYINN